MLSDFRAETDLRGGRINISWSWSSPEERWPGLQLLRRQRTYPDRTEHAVPVLDLGDLFQTPTRLWSRLDRALYLFHYEEGNLGGALRMYRSCRVYLSPFAPETAGIDVSLLLSDLDRCFEQLSEYQNRTSEQLALDPDLIPKIRFSE